MAARNERTRAAERTRDAERTKEAILIAAEDRFARLGFDGTSLQQIGEAAGGARSTPAYFFRSKEALYDAVLARAVTRAQEAMARAYAEEDEDRSAEDAVESYVGAFLDFLGHDRNFVRLIQREALADGSRVAEFFGRSVDEAVAEFDLHPSAELIDVKGRRAPVDPDLFADATRVGLRELRAFRHLASSHRCELRLEPLGQLTQGPGPVGASESQWRRVAAPQVQPPVLIADGRDLVEAEP